MTGDHPESASSWSALYAAGYDGSPLPAPLLELPVRPGARVLDIGCGRGRHMAHWGTRAVGIDFSMTALTDAHGSSRRTACAHASRLPFRSGSFGLAYSLGVIEHLTDTELAVRGSFAVLAPGGWAYHSVPHTRSVWTWCVRPLKKALGRFPVGREASFSVKEMRRMFESAGFADIAHRVMPFAAYDCHAARWPLPLLYRAEDFLNARLPGVGFFLHMWGRKP